MTFRRCFAAAAAGLAALTTVALEAHITPQVILRTQADVIRAALPNAARYKVTTVQISKPQLAALEDHAHYRPNTDAVKFYSGEDATGRNLGTVVFPQIDTQHGPIEVGVAVDADGHVTAVMVTRATVEMKPWVFEVEASGALKQLTGGQASDPPRKISGGALGAMPGYVADAIATAVFRGLALVATLRA